MTHKPKFTSSALITGGARSGKSAFAETLTQSQSKAPIYIATCEIFDDEMAARVKTHQMRRSKNWQNIHAPLDLASALDDSDHDETRLVDCLTYWVNNLLHHKRDWQQNLDELLEAIARQNAPVIFVTNEIGMGIIPESKLGREFRDIAGTVNQAIAGVTEDMYLVVSGRAIRIEK